MAEKIIIGSKTNGVSKLGVGRYYFSFKKRKKNNPEFKRTKTYETTKGLQVVKAEYSKWLNEVGVEYEVFLSNPHKLTKVEKLRFRDVTENKDTYWQKWVLEHYEKGSQKNLLDNMKVINSYKWFVNLELEDITKKNCSDLLDLIKEKKNIKPNTVQKYKQTLSSAFIFVNDKLAREINNPTIGIKLGHETTRKASELKKTANILRGSDIDVLIKRITETKEYRFQVFIKTVLGTALRRGEIMGLEWKNIRFKDNYIEVYNTMIEYEGSWLLTDYTKNKTHRIVPLFPSIKKMLEEYQEYCKQEKYEIYEDEEGNKYDFVFSKKNGEPYKVNRYSKILTAVVKELNKEGVLIPTPTLHDLRGTAITRFLIDRNISLPLVQKLAGHTDPTVTLSYYVNVVDKDIIDLSTKYDIED